MPTGKEYAALAMEVYNLKPQAGYIWGQRGATWTKEKQDALVKKYNSDPARYSDYKMGAQYGKKWIGHRVWDCSGLTSERAAKLGLSYHHGSNSSYNYDCSHKGKKTTGLKIPVGAWMYTGSAGAHGHIGIVVDDTWVVEAQGTKAGVTRTKITDKKWTYWGLGKGLEFDFIPGQTDTAGKDQKETAKEPAQTATDTKVYYPTLRRGARGENVVQLQRLLSMDGSNLEIDGIFGPGTQSAVRSFQKRHGLVVDGIVGPKTWAELLKLALT